MTILRLIPVLWLLLATIFSVPAGATAFDDPGSRTASGGAASADVGLVPVKPDTDGGEISVGGSQQVVVLFRNTMTQPIEIGAVNLYPSSTVTASVAMNDCVKEPLPSGAECPIALSVSAFQTGPWRVEMLVRHSGRSRVVTATVRGTVASGENGDEQVKTDLQPVPDSIDFGTLTSGKPLVRSIVVRNVTSGELTVKDVTLQASATAEYNLETNCEKLQTGQACLVSLSWSPKQKGPSEGFIVVQHTGSTGVTSIPIKGIFEPGANEKATMFPNTIPGRGVLVSSEEEIEFGEAVDSEASYTLSLVNVGDADLELQKIALSGADTGLSIGQNGCTQGRVLAPVEACALTVVWSPLRASPVRDDLQITHDGARGVLVIPITGTATKTYNRDSKSIVARGGVYKRQINPEQVLQGYIVSSHSPTRAIINGPGGSRVVLDGQQLSLGGIKWRVHIVETGVEMIDGDDKVLLLFDRSLSTGSRASTSASAGVVASSTASTTGTASSASAPAPTTP